MSAEEVAKIIRDDIDRDQLIDIADELRANRKTGGEHAVGMGLTGRGAARIAGLATYELNVQRLADVTAAHGGLPLGAGCFPGTTLRNYKPLGRYGRVLLGLASIEAPGEMPASNITHRNGATLNYRYSDRPLLPGLERDLPEEEVVYAILMTVRDRENVEKIDHIALGVLEHDFSGFLFYQEFDSFLEGYVHSADHAPPEAERAPMDIKLREGVKPFVGGEADESVVKKA